MHLIQVPVGVAPCQIDDFPAEVVEDGKTRPFERSCKGALHLRPATTMRVTDDELNHMRTAKLHKAFGRRLLVVQVKAKGVSAPTPPPAVSHRMSAFHAMGETDTDSDE